LLTTNATGNTIGREEGRKIPVALQTLAPPAPPQADLAVSQPPVVLHFSPVIDLSDDEFYEFCQLNADLRIERNSEGDVILMTPVGGEAGSRNMSLAIAVGGWAKQDGRGIAFDSSTGFILPNGATRSPDAAWVRRERLLALAPAQKQKFLPLCPDFVVELRSPSDRLSALEEKLAEYMANGAQLGWLLIPETRTAIVYRPGEEPLTLVDPVELTGDPLLPGFTLQLTEIWDPGF
jgi:Uma2 family endonuclease